MSKQMSLSTVSTAGSKMTRRYFAGHTIWYWLFRSAVSASMGEDFWMTPHESSSI
jgi:hypothetical protein